MVKESDMAQARIIISILAELKEYYARIFFLSLLVFLVTACSQKKMIIDNDRGELEIIANTYGQFAPDDAFEEDSEFAYYGSENEWSRRQFREISADKLYKRRGQRQLLEIMDGMPEKAIEYCERRLEENPNDPEIHFMKTVAYSEMGKPNKAVQSMQLALDNGLPFDRFIAGPRDFLDNLYKTKEFKALEKKHNIELVHGPMLGNITQTGANIWVRTARESKVAVLCEKIGGGGRPVSGEARSSSENDYTTVVKVDGLNANTKYSYSILIDEKEVATGYEFTTDTDSKNGALFNIGFGGGAGYTPQQERIWDSIATHDLKAFMLLGDNVYIDIPEHPSQIHDYTYYRRQSRPEFKNLTSKTPIYAIWDDHDAGTDDIWMGPYRDKPNWKQPMVNLFRNNWNNPGYGAEEFPGCWFKFSVADVDFFMLDGRTYRTNPFKVEKTMLGPAQKEWLLAGLKESKATFKIIVSPVPWDFRAKPGSNDTWNGFQNEREEIFNFIGEKKVDGVVLVSADRHRSDYWKIERGNTYPLYDFLSSRLTNIHTHGLMEGCEFGYNEKCSYAILSFNTTISDPEMAYKIYSIDNELIHTFELKRSQILFR